MGVEGEVGETSMETPFQDSHSSSSKGLADHFRARHSMNIFWAKLLGRIEAWLILKKNNNKHTLTLI